MQSPGHLQQFAPMPKPIHTPEKEGDGRKLVSIRGWRNQPCLRREFCVLLHAEFQQGSFRFAVHGVCWETADTPFTTRGN